MGSGKGSPVLLWFSMLTNAPRVSETYETFEFWKVNVSQDHEVCAIFRCPNLVLF